MMNNLQHVDEKFYENVIRTKNFLFLEFKILLLYF